MMAPYLGVYVVDGMPAVFATRTRVSEHWFDVNGVDRTAVPEHLYPGGGVCRSTPPCMCCVSGLDMCGFGLFAFEGVVVCLGMVFVCVFCVTGVV